MSEQRARRAAIAIGDPAGIGCEIALKALQQPRVRAAVRAVLIGDAWLIEHCKTRFEIPGPLRIVASPEELRFDGTAIEVLDVSCLQESEFEFGVVSAANGRALLAYAEAAIRIAQRGLVDFVVAAPQNQTSVKRAGIAFDGYNGFVAKITGTAEEETFLMISSSSFHIAHVTLHVSMRRAIELMCRDRVLRAIKATDAAMRRMGIVAPRIAVSGLNPHAGESGLFGDEEANEIAPAIAEAQAMGINAAGPFGADLMFARAGYDAYVVMTHDQGHIPGKLEHGSAGFYIGAPILFGSVAHGSAHDIAGGGIADPSHIINALLRGAGAHAGPSAQGAAA
jgi:4-hydroxy-L-threonine phosphate dehydrogenase PdxA